VLLQSRDSGRVGTLAGAAKDMIDVFLINSFIYLSLLQAGHSDTISEYHLDKWKQARHPGKTCHSGTKPAYHQGI